MNRLDAIAARAAAANRKPIALRSAAATAGAFEERAVKEVLRQIGRGELVVQMKQASIKLTGKPVFSFALFHQMVPEFPLLLRASRLRFDFDGVFMQLMNNFADTPMWSAWQDSASTLDADDDRAAGLIFSWPRVRGCKQMCVLHDAATSTWSGSRIQRAVGDRIFTVETLPSLLAGLGVAIGGGEEIGDDESVENGDG